MTSKPSHPQVDARPLPRPSGMQTMTPDVYEQLRAAVREYGVQSTIKR